MRTFQKALVGLAGVAGTVPGLATLQTGFGSPPGSRGVFGLGAEVISACVIAVVLLSRGIIASWSHRTVVLNIVGSLTLFLAILAAFFVSFNRAVVEHEWYQTPRAILIPLAPEEWVPPRLDSLIACTAEATLCANASSIHTSEDVARAITRYGPDEVLPLIPPEKREETILLLFILYAVSVATLMWMFGIAVVRLVSSNTSESA